MQQPADSSATSTSNSVGSNATLQALQKSLFFYYFFVFVAFV